MRKVATFFGALLLTVGVIGLIASIFLPFVKYDLGILGAPELGFHAIMSLGTDEIAPGILVMALLIIGGTVMFSGRLFGTLMGLFLILGTLAFASYGVYEVISTILEMFGDAAETSITFDLGIFCFYGGGLVIFIGGLLGASGQKRKKLD